MRLGTLSEFAKKRCYFYVDLDIFVCLFVVCVVFSKNSKNVIISISDI